MSNEYTPECPECGHRTWFKRCSKCGYYHDAIGHQTAAATSPSEAPGSAFCRCATCGYQWQRGLDGSHSCSDHLRGMIDSIKSVATGEDQVADDDTGGLKWIADYINGTFGG